MKYLDKVKITEKYDRHWKTGNVKYWRKLPFVSEGVIIGFRTLTNGINFNGDYGETYYEAKEHFKVAVVVFNQFKNPVYVPLESIEGLK